MSGRFHAAGLLLPLLLLPPLLLAACLPVVAPRPDAVPTTERGEEARRLVDNGAQVVDVRTPGEYEAGHVEGAVNISVVELKDRLKELGPRDRTVIVYCRSGHRSAAAAGILRGAGFTQVFDLGSIKNW
ncbi:MAG TPA: rhodanese-like domain-containing protein [Myxococcales bacterium]|jgi:rhodanese-related sulfurtransferase